MKAYMSSFYWRQYEQYEQMLVINFCNFFVLPSNYKTTYQK